jgi:hypothetical protein
VDAPDCIAVPGWWCVESHQREASLTQINTHRGDRSLRFSLKEWLAERMPDFTGLRTMTQTKMSRLPWLELSIGEGTANAWPDINALRMPADEDSELLLTKAGILVSPGY